MVRRRCGSLVRLPALFFQSVLLLGYLYAHLLTRKFDARIQGRIHVCLLAASLLALPILPKNSWTPSGAGDPALRVLVLLTATVGLPYFLLSSTSPLLQAWYARSCSNATPTVFMRSPMRAQCWLCSATRWRSSNRSPGFCWEIATACGTSLGSSTRGMCSRVTNTPSCGPMTTAPCCHCLSDDTSDKRILANVSTELSVPSFYNSNCNSGHLPTPKLLQG